MEENKDIDENIKKNEIKEIIYKKENNLEKALKISNDELLAKSIQDLLKRDDYTK